VVVAVEVAWHGKATPANGCVERINLKQGKWLDDFIDVLQLQNYVPSRPIVIKTSSVPMNLALLAISVPCQPQLLCHQP
jgi:hypothetical protein